MPTLPFRLIQGAQRTLSFSFASKIKAGPQKGTLTDQRDKTGETDFDLPDKISSEVTNGRDFQLFFLWDPSEASAAAACALQLLFRDTAKLSPGGCRWTNKIVFVPSKWSAIDRADRFDLFKNGQNVVRKSKCQIGSCTIGEP